jgi:arylsulfatase A-like enzyme
MNSANSFLRSVFLFIIGTIAVVYSEHVSADERPNIIFLMTDDQCTYSLGCYDNADVKTPNIDKLAKAGVTFDRHYANTAICMASRATVMTGKYEYKTGCNFQHGAMLQSIWEESYPRLLRNAGYTTAFAGKFGFEVKKTANVEDCFLPIADFDTWGGGPGQTSYQTKSNSSMARYARDFPHATRSYGAFGRDFIQDAANSNRPFCLSISFKAPHRPATPDPNFDDIYAGKSFQKPKNFGREFGEHFSAQSKVDRQFERFYSWNYADKYDQVMAKYHQQIYGVDVAVGMIVDAVAKAGVADKTVIIFTSDNGFFCGSHGYGSKVLPYEESSRIPLVVFDPRHKNSHKNTRCSALTGLIDISPTILGLAGIDVPENVDGKDLMRLYSDANASLHEDIVLMNVWGQRPTHSLTVVTQDTKYVFWPYGGDGMEPAEELYDLANDSLETKNLAIESRALPQLNDMRRRYDQHVNRWNSNSIAHHGYKPYGTIFDRDVPWDQKSELYPTPARYPAPKPK